MKENPLIFSEDYYQQLDDAQQKHWWCRGMRRIQAALLNQYLRNEKTIDVLDAGCGTGASFPWIRRHLPSLRRLTGFDLSSHALHLGRARGYETPVCQASVLALPFRSLSFDLVLCDDVLQHVYSADNHVLSEFHRVLRPGGWLLLRTNARHCFGSNDDPAWDFHRYSRTELQEKASEAGFTVVRCTHVNTLPSLIAEGKNIWNSRKRNTQGAYSGLKLEDRGPLVQTTLYNYMVLEAELISRLKITLPYGHSLIVMLQKKIDSSS